MAERCSVERYFLPLMESPSCVRGIVHFVDEIDVNRCLADCHAFSYVFLMLFAHFCLSSSWVSTFSIRDLMFGSYANLIIYLILFKCAVYAIRIDAPLGDLIGHKISLGYCFLIAFHLGFTVKRLISGLYLRGCIDKSQYTLFLFIDTSHFRVDNG